MTKQFKLGLVSVALWLAGCAGAGAGHLTCYKLNGEVMFDDDVRAAYVSDTGAWLATTESGENVTVTGDCVYFDRVSR